MSGFLKRCINGTSSKFAVVLGSQWGDEGKGKLVDYLSHNYDITARFNGGNNSGHVIHKNDKKFELHILPCGILSQSTKNLIGNGCVVHLEGFFQELKALNQNGISYKNRIFVSDRAHLVTQYHIDHDLQIELSQGIGITGRGIGPAYAAKAHRFGLRVGDLRNWNQFVQKYQKMAAFYNKNINYAELQKFKELGTNLFEEQMVVDPIWLNKRIDAGERVLAQSCNGSLLDLDLGTYPYVAANATTIGAVGTGLGVSPRKIQTIIGVTKAYTTRVEQGPFSSQLVDSTGSIIRQAGNQYGIVTGRQRRCGWLDLALVRYAAISSGYDSLNITKLDVLNQLDEIKVAVSHKLDGKQISIPPQTIFEFGRVETRYETFKGWKKDISQIEKKEELPQQALDYLKFIQDYTNIPISWVGVGRSTQALIPML